LAVPHDYNRGPVLREVLAIQSETDLASALRTLELVARGTDGAGRVVSGLACLAELDLADTDGGV
jgi:hypothetical protein